MVVNLIWRIHGANLFKHYVGIQPQSRGRAGSTTPTPPPLPVLRYLALLLLLWHWGSRPEHASRLEQLKTWLDRVRFATVAFGNGKLLQKLKPSECGASLPKHWIIRYAQSCLGHGYGLINPCDFFA